MSFLKENRPTFMGVLNITPDSFSDGGEFFSKQEAWAQLTKLKQNGADIIDIGAESTGPGSSPIGSKEEVSRLKNIFEDSTLLQDLCISVDTYRADTASFCLEKGAKIINDVSALRADSAMHHVINEHKAYVVIMYSKQCDKNPNVKEENIEYDDVIETIISFLEQRIEFALSKGIDQTKIIIDPGMGGFISKNPKYSWEVLRRLSEIVSHFKDFPLLIGTSRKGFLGGNIEDRDPISQLTSFEAYSNGARIIRSHDIRMAREFHTTLNLLRHQ